MSKVSEATFVGFGLVGTLGESLFKGVADGGAVYIRLQNCSNKDTKGGQSWRILRGLKSDRLSHEAVVEGKSAITF